MGGEVFPNYVCNYMVLFIECCINTSASSKRIMCGSVFLLQQDLLHISRDISEEKPVLERSCTILHYLMTTELYFR
jgi:hypothetical protein